jgi:hypothetical protein
MNLEQYFEDPYWVKKMQAVFCFLLVLLVLADFFIEKDHAVLPWESLPGFYAVFGLLATLLIIGVSKLLGHLFILRKEENHD